MDIITTIFLIRKYNDSEYSLKMFSFKNFETFRVQYSKLR